MSGHVDTIVGTKEIIRYHVCCEDDKGEKTSRQYKHREAAVDWIETRLLMGFQKLEMFKNTRTYKTERIL